jgi:F1F0 ATPase subunit 2
MIRAEVFPVFGMALLGVALGLGYFATLRRTVAHLAGHRGWLVPATLTLGRIGAATVPLAVVAQSGAASLLAAFAGFLLARSAMLHVIRSAD